MLNTNTTNVGGIMAYQHYIQKVREMEPRGGNSFATTYYNASKEENKNLFDYVEAYVNGMKADLQSDPDPAVAIYGKELGGKHKKQDGTPYRICDVLIDIYVQLDEGRNATKSMIDRWNAAMHLLKLFEDTIDIELGVRPAPGLPKNLFEESE